MLNVEASPLSREIVDTPTYVVSVNKVLRAHGKTVATLMRGSFTLMPGQQKEESDIHWGSRGLVVRQNNVFAVTP